MKPEIVKDERTGREVVAMAGSRGQMTWDPHAASIRLTDGKLLMRGGSLNWPDEVAMANHWLTERGVPETPIVELGGE